MCERFGVEIHRAFWWAQQSHGWRPFKHGLNNIRKGERIRFPITVPPMGQCGLHIVCEKCAGAQSGVATTFSPKN